MSLTDPPHRHDRTCWWDHLRCGWVCAPAAPGPGRPGGPGVEGATARGAGAREPRVDGTAPRHATR
jgi:hypothetical protein